MNVNAPGKAGAASSSAAMLQPAHGSTQDASASPDSRITASGHPETRRLRESIADSRTVRSRVETEAPPGPMPAPVAAAPQLGRLPIAAIKGINQFFELGSANASRLQGQGKHLFNTCGERALADRLAAALDTRPVQGITNHHFTNIIDQTQFLGAELRHAVLALIPAKLCEHLHSSGSNMEVVLQRLLTASAAGFDPQHRYLLIDRISAAFKQPAFRAHFHDATSQVIQRWPMESVFNNLVVELNELVNQRNAPSLALALAQDPTDQTGTAATTDAQARHDVMTACTVTPLTRGLYMLHDHEIRFDAFMWMTSCIASASPDVRKTLLTNLIPEISYLQPEARRVAAFNQILESIEALSPDAKLDPVEATIAHLQCITDTVANTILYDSLLKNTQAAPAEQRAPLLAKHADALATRPPDTRVALFNKILTSVGQVPVNDQNQILEALAPDVSGQPEGIPRTQAYDAVFAAIKRLPKEKQVVAARLLFGTIDSLPPDQTRHVQFVAAANFIKLHPVEARFEMLDQLQDSIWCQDAYGTELHCLEEFLTLLQSQSPEERQGALTVLYDTGSDTLNDGTKFAMLRTIFREVEKLPQSRQSNLISAAAQQAGQLDSPYMAFLVNDVVECALALPPEARVHALQDIGRHLSNVVNMLAFEEEADGQLPRELVALLDTSDVLPEAMQVTLLAELKQSLAHCPAALLADASRAVSGKVNALPLHLVAQFIKRRPG